MIMYDNNDKCAESLNYNNPYKVVAAVSSSYLFLFTQ